MSLWCLGQSPQILWGKNEKQSPSWGSSGVKGRLNAALLLLFWSRERSWAGGMKGPELCSHFTGRRDWEEWRDIVVVIFKWEVGSLTTA